MNIADPTICEWSPAPYLIYSDNIWGSFIYYSHIFPAITGLIISIFVLKHSPNSLPARFLFFTTLMFAIWSFMDLILWATDRSDIIMFVWSALTYFEILIYIGTLYFIYSYFYKSLPPLKYEFLVASLFLPIFLFSHTSLNLTGFDFTNCWREAIEGPLWTVYLYNLELLIILIIVIISIKQVYSSTKLRLEAFMVGGGAVLFLTSFAAGNILGSLETDWEIGQIGLFGMPIFVALLAYSIVKFNTFRIKVMATEVLIVGISILISSLLFLRTIDNVRIVAAFTLVLIIFLGILLIRSVRREVKQREQLELLTTQLAKANKRLQELDKAKSEFVSIASHQLRSPLTSMRGYASMLLEGSYGQLPQKAKEIIERIADSSKIMAASIEDYLNVSRIESGNMKYEYSDFNLRDQVEIVVDDKRPEAIKKGLLLLFKTDLHQKGIVNADIGKTLQIVHNLINNSMKYTPKGSVTVYVHDDPAAGKIFVSVSDTGIGMSADTIDDLFGKFNRAANANSVNITGTGLGLYVARSLASAMGGTVTASSPGDGQGSTFTLELPLKM